MAINSIEADIRSLIGSAGASGSQGSGSSEEVASASESQDGISYVGEDSEESVTSGESDQDVDLLTQGDDESEGGENAPEDSAETNSASKATGGKEATQKTPGKEVITVTDEKGKRKIEVDLTDRESVVKHIQMAYGARKWQAERDQARTQAKELEGKVTELSQRWDAIEQAYKGGVEGLVDFLEGKPGAYKEFEQKRFERAKFLEKATPEQKQLFEEREQAARDREETKRIKEEQAKFLENLKKEREEAEYKVLESQVNPVFDRYRFAGKLGDSHDEQMFDEMLWNTAIKRLQPFEDNGTLTQELVDKEFRSVASALRKRISVQAEKKAAVAVEKKKQEATENVQQKVMSGYKTSSVAKEASDRLNNGDLMGLLKNWNKYKSAFK